jgi:hypothetical protein
MSVGLVVVLVVGAGAVVAAAVSALLHRSPWRAAAPGHPGTLETFRGRLAVGLSTLAVILGTVAAGLAPGGWLGSERGKPDQWPNNALTGLSERLGFQAWTLVPLTGLALAVVGLVGLVVCWAAAAPPAPDHGKPRAAPGTDLL